MVDAGDDYRELLKKEQRRRKIKMFRHLLGFTIMIAFLIYILYYHPMDTLWMLVLVGVIIYANYEFYRLIKQIRAFISLDDELHYEEGEITKFNVRRKKTKKRIPIENVEEVYLNVQDKPNLLFVVYEKNGAKMADSFYKQRIKEREKFMADLEERSLIEDEPVTFEELKEKVEGS
ncbi:MAG: hypothetical protein ACOC8Y_01270 [Candidatus Natronoplasma sp.]